MNWRTSSHSAYNGACIEAGSWRTSSHSSHNGACIEAGSWRTSSHSFANGNCAEAGSGPGVIAVRDTKQAHLGDARTVLQFTPAAWREFTGRIR